MRGGDQAATLRAASCELRANSSSSTARQDTIGLDTVLSIMETLHRETGDSKYRPAALLSRMVDAGWYGRKSGKGFYECV